MTSSASSLLNAALKGALSRHSSCFVAKTIQKCLGIKARETTGVKGEIGFGFASHWLKSGWNIFESIASQLQSRD